MLIQIKVNIATWACVVVSRTDLLSFTKIQKLELLNHLFVNLCQNVSHDAAAVFVYINYSVPLETLDVTPIF